ncbi:MAG: glycoside hydrolase family 18 protein [Candidatus Schekmanbacteria bacterium]|nr:glycoside hydrolase family 18 protein [Candidatus Schekmanbacteria bacterium]
MMDKATFRYTVFFMILAVLLMVSILFGYSFWKPGLDVTDGRYDVGKNGIWIQHGWIGGDEWFVENDKKDRIIDFRNAERVKALATQLREHNITYVFPHLCPTSVNGVIPNVDSEQTKLFLKTFEGLNVMPWVGGVRGIQAFPEKPEWRKNFAGSIRNLLTTYPEFSGIHINIEPSPVSSREFLVLLDEVKSAFPEDGKKRILSVAISSPPMLSNPFSKANRKKDYYREVAKHCDQMVVMMYDTSIQFEKVYQYLMAKWTQEIISWSGERDVLLGIPAYKDEGVYYHNPRVENIENALLGINAGLSHYATLPKNYQGISIYCEWEMEPDEWKLLEEHFQQLK